jgi:hypothetical protein
MASFFFVFKQYAISSDAILLILMLLFTVNNNHGMYTGQVLRCQRTFHAEWNLRPFGTTDSVISYRIAAASISVRFE